MHLDPHVMLFHIQKHREHMVLDNDKKNIVYYMGLIVEHTFCKLVKSHN